MGGVIEGQKKPLQKMSIPAHSPQYAWFTDTWGDDCSNMLDLWDQIPKYKQRNWQKTVRSESGRLEPQEQLFTYSPSNRSQKMSAKVVLTPASIKENGKVRDYFPGHDEELIEHALRKLFCDQRFGMHDPKREESYVEFTLYQLQQELKARGATRSLDDIKRSIQIMNLSNLQVSLVSDSETVAYQGPYLPEVASRKRNAYLVDPKSKWRVRLPVLYSKSIDAVAYRQFNYGKLMSLPTMAARWMHRRMVQNFTQAHVTNTYTIAFSTIMQDSGLFNNKRSDRNRKAIIEMLDELKAHDVIMYYKVSVSKTNPKDRVVEIHPTENFSKEQTQSNARQKDHLERQRQMQLDLGSSDAIQIPQRVALNLRADRK